MEAIRKSASTAASLAQNSIDTALANQDAKEIMQAREKGERVNTLDNDGRSPMDRLDAMQGIAGDSRSTLRRALLQSLNPTVPAGYLKPEALHGSPWGIEILGSGALRGGVTDTKGGSQSLNGKVFFSDRTPQRDNDTTTRENLRSKARVYSQGKGIVSACATSRSQQHRLAQVMMQILSSGRHLSLTEKKAIITINESDNIDEKGAAWLQDFLHNKYIVMGRGRPFLSGSIEDSARGLKLPHTIELNTGNSVEKCLDGRDLIDFYKNSASLLCTTLENGKAPYLSLINQGVVVPVVFGFEKINHLSSHPIYRSSDGIPERYSYKNKDHPLAGDASGGKLKEIEVRHSKDLATLCLGCIVTDIKMPEDILVRVKGAKQEKAEYVSQGRMSDFQARIFDVLEKYCSSKAQLSMQSLSLMDIQEINKTLRSMDLEI